MLDHAEDIRCLSEVRRWRKPEAEDVVGYNSSRDVALRPEDVILVDVKIDLTNGENNPVDRVRAAGKHLANAHQSFIVFTNQVMPECIGSGCAHHLMCMTTFCWVSSSAWHLKLAVCALSCAVAVVLELLLSSILIHGFALFIFYN